MKSFAVSLLLFTVMLGGILVNGRYLHTLADTLDSATEAIPTCGDDNAKRDALDRVCAIWERNRTAVSLSVTVRVTEGIDDCLGKMNAALKYGEDTEFDASKEHLLRIIEDIRRYDRLQLGSIL